MQVSELHRYPVKSMLGEALAEVQVGANGFVGDRAWALRNSTGSLTGKKFPALMSAAAKFSTQPTLEEGSAAAQITLPDGTSLSTGDTDISAKLGAWLETDVQLWPLVSAENLDFFRRATQEDVTPEQMELALREVFSRLPDEPLPDMMSWPSEVLEYDSPPGTYFDAYPILLLSTAALHTLSSQAPNNFDTRRFRPNILIDGLSGAFPENDWVGKQVKIGSAVLSIEMPCPRCIMTTQPVAEIPKDPKIMRHLVTHNDGNLGVYARVVQPGTMSRGDALHILQQPVDQTNSKRSDQSPNRDRT